MNSVFLKTYDWLEATFSLNIRFLSGKKFYMKIQSGFKQKSYDIKNTNIHIIFKKKMNFNTHTQQKILNDLHNKYRQSKT